MPEGPDGKTIIIIKKVVGHGGHHGGAWKVAYADFVTAMMALFLVLWLVASAASTVKKQVSSYFERPGLFLAGSGTPLEIGGAGILPEAFAPSNEGEARIDLAKKLYDAKVNKGDLRDAHKAGDIPSDQELIPSDKENASGEGDKAEKENSERESLEQLGEKISEMIGQQGLLSTELGQVEVKVDQKGLHLEIMDTEKDSMFQKGSAQILPSAESQLKKIADVLKQLPNPIDIDGHTDATPFRSGLGIRYDNWDLSTDRANAARRALQSVGIKDTQIARVVGYASTRLRNSAQPTDAANRRISISMRLTDQALEALSPLGARETRSVPLGQKSAPSSSPGVGEVPMERGGSGLKVEVGVGSEPSEFGDNQAPVPTRPNQWVDDDRIFGEVDPFFVQPPKEQLPPATTQEGSAVEMEP